MLMSSKKAFTMIELVFVIVVIGILAAIAVPKMAATRDDATITKAIATIGSVRSAIVTERQKRILRGDFTNPITTLHSADGVFDIFNVDADGNRGRVLEYPVLDCTAQGKSKGCWSVNGTTYTYTMPTSGSVDFNITSSRFNCKVPTDSNCRLLTP
ncbi:type II secretion system protein [Sulfurovum sp.]|uniref:type II secretion system protein n=1 Tax=Sulfurovum sp. TaxID=1969726 RepID=UPI0028681310|nr:type II secretion system protein [Sulfurovum sp.]